MSSDLPEYYFRVRENGAIVFRVVNDSRLRRLDMKEIAVINTRNGQIKPHGNNELSDDAREVINDWMAERREVLAARDIDDIYRAVDYLNLTSQWAHSTATDEQLEEVSTALLLAMHDLRSVLVRKKADRVPDEQQ